ILDWLSYVQPFAKVGITPWNPSTGLTIALILLYGPKYLLMLPFGAMISDMVVRGGVLPAWTEFGSALIISTVYGAAGVLLGHSRLKFDPTLSTMRDLGYLLGFCGLATIMAAFSEIGFLVACGALQPSQFYAAATRFWVGDMIGITIV